MPMLPIDLQTMFSHMNQIGKEQAVLKEVSHLHQSLQGMEIARQSKDKDTQVNETNNLGDGLEKIKDEEKKKGQGKEGEKKEKGKDINKIEEKEVITESHLGHHIDITG